MRRLAISIIKNSGLTAMSVRGGMLLIKALNPLSAAARHFSDDMASKVMRVVGFEQVRDGLGNNTMLLVDVRNDHERRDPGRIPGTVNVPCK